MIVGIGVDVVGTERMARSLESDGAFEMRVFSATERADCRERADRPQALAARFAAKEACLKALGTGWSAGTALQDVEVRLLPGGRPELLISGAAARRAARLGVHRIHVSLTHDTEVGAAIVVLEGGRISRPE